MKNINKKILALIAYIASAVLGNLNADILDVEKDTLKFGFIKLTDCAPIVIAKEKGYFDDEGLSVEEGLQLNGTQEQGLENQISSKKCILKNATSK